MGIFRKPFYKNKTKEELKNWFRSQKQWNKLDDLVIEAIINKFFDDRLAFEAFIDVSESCNLIQNNYVPLKETIGNIDLLLSNFSLTLYNNGGYFRDKLVEESKNLSPNLQKLTELLKFSQLSYESSIKLNEFCFGAYYQIAFLRGCILKKYDQGIDWCRKGLEKVDKLKGIPKSQLTYTEQAALNQIEQTIKLFDDAILQYEEQLKLNA